ncbi:MAG: EAL domain-containing protein [Gammaproteobacteria bacterium]|nr:EAL domain-containing protein [Gammaproteobacteria bacterium]
MSDYSPVLKRQIASFLSAVDIEKSPWKEFLSAVDQAYVKYDVDQRTLEHSLTLSAEELVQANEEMHAVFQAIPDQLFHLSNEGRVISYKSGGSSNYYLKSDRLINELMRDITSREVADKFDGAISEVVNSSRTIHFEFVIVHDKKIYYYEVRMMPLKSNHVLALVRDITERRLAEEQIAYLAYHDNLTGLPNNRLFRDRLEQGIAHAERSNSKLAVLFLDLDRFKLINDSMGHSVGDELLQITSERLIEGVRRSDSVALNMATLNTSVARLGGDEFTIMLEDIEDISSVSRVAERLIENVGKPFELSNQEVHISTSIGVAIYPEDGSDAGMLLKNADVAMYHAKDQGRNNFQFFNESMNAASHEQLMLENNLHKALKNKELCLYYQPQVNIISGELIGMEALIRWKHPERGFISPGVFIPIAEETGLIMEIGEWVIREACEQGARWIKEGYKIVKISVNLSAKQLKEPKLCDMIDSVLSETGMNPEFLGIELTESAIILEPEIALLRLDRIKSLGISLSLDDFGTGYSSLSYLKRFPIDTLKIDQAFIRDVTVDQEDASLVKAIISMAHGLGMDVVAEGVEVQEQLEFLGVNACDTIQGYLFSRPVPAEKVKQMLKKR